MTSASDRPDPAMRALQLAKAALQAGDRAEARRQARAAAKWSPDQEAPWLFLAAAADDPRAGLAYAARAIECNPASRAARKAIHWWVRRLPPRQRADAIRSARLPEGFPLQPAPLEALTRLKLISLPTLLPALVVLLLIAAWLGLQPAAAKQPQQNHAPAAKASFTPTPTHTPTATPTATPSATPTETPIPTATSSPTPKPAVSWDFVTDPRLLAQEGRWIDVDLSEQKVTAYEGVNPIRSFIVSTGVAAHPTLTGQFHIYVKLRSTPMSGPGYYLPGVPFTMYFYRGYALHGTYWHHNFGTPMSHGCINLQTPDAQWLYGFASVGTLVNVHP
jgi:lipoprotein-anchoring transpeptidase ErfK/SrfK